jgi:hypothetical protein
MLKTGLGRSERLRQGARHLPLAPVWILVSFESPAQKRNVPAQRDIFSKSNLVARRVVSFDDKHRGPAERAEMLKD